MTASKAAREQRAQKVAVLVVAVGVGVLVQSHRVQAQRSVPPRRRCPAGRPVRRTRRSWWDARAPRSR